MLAKRTEIVAENQGSGHDACKGCPHLRRGLRPRQFMIKWLGITHYVACNLACSYCWLQWSDWSPKRQEDRPPAQAYPILPVLRQLLDANLLAPRAFVHWGGGGEPTLGPEFDASFALMHRFGAKQQIETNAVRLSHPLLDLPASYSNGRCRFYIRCSIDAGTAETYALVKGRDCFDQVWANISAYARHGAFVYAKYLLTPDNAAPEELMLFVQRAKEAGVKCIQGDVDLRSPIVSSATRQSLMLLAKYVCRAGLQYQLDSCGIFANPTSRLASLRNQIAFRLRLPYLAKI
jgi:sulfatase maturation enzyme AslB (radical SAM superfamily)